MNTMHLFAGCGGGLLGDLILGHKPIIAVEWDKYACEVLRKRAKIGWFPDLSVWEGDVRLFDPSEYAGVVDCIHAGFPCQDISIAGKRAGVEEGARSGLYREVLRIADVVRPKFIFLENVSAILTNGLGTVLADLASMGFDARWCCLRASEIGANHHRDRWWLLAYSSSIRLQRKRSTGIGKQKKSRKQSREKVARNNIYNVSNKCWWEIEPKIQRVADGISDRIHRLKGLGNAQVPLQMAVAYKILESME